MLKKLSFRRSAMVIGALLAASIVSAVRAVEPEVLTKVPADAYGVVVVNNVRTFANKVSSAATRLSVPLPTPDLVGYMTRTMGITKGFDANSSAAIVLLKPPADRQGESYFSNQPPAVILLPTSDAKGMLEPFKPGEPDKNGISQVTMVQDEEKGFVAVVDNKWVAFSPTKDDLTAYMTRTDSFAAKASPDIRRIFDVNDLVVWGNVQKLSIGADKALDDARTDMSGMLELAAVAGTEDPVASALQKQAVNTFFAFIKQFLKDADASMMTVRLTDSGATLGIAGDFKPDSTIGKFVAAQKSSRPVTLQGLPSAGSGFLAAGAANWDSATMSTVLDNFTQALLSDETIAKDKRAADIKKSMDLQRQLIAITTGASFILLDPPAGGDNGYIAGVALMETKDPAKLQELQTQMLQSAFIQDSMNPDIKQTVTVAPDAITVKGVKLSKFNVKLALREDTPDKPLNDANKMVFQMLQKVYGKEGLTAYFGTVGNRGVIIYGSDSGTIEAGVSAAQANSNELGANPTIAATKDQLVANPVAVAYLPVTRWITLASSIIRPPAAGDAPLSQAILNAPPIVMSAGVTNNMMTAEIHVPIATVTGIMEAYARMQRAMGGE